MWTIFCCFWFFNLCFWLIKPRHCDNCYSHIWQYISSYCCSCHSFWFWRFFYHQRHIKQLSNYPLQRQLLLSSVRVMVIQLVYFSFFYHWDFFLWRQIHNSATQTHSKMPRRLLPQAVLYHKWLKAWELCKVHKTINFLCSRFEETSTKIYTQQSKISKKKLHI